MKTEIGIAKGNCVEKTEIGVAEKICVFGVGVSLVKLIVRDNARPAAKAM